MISEKLITGIKFPVMLKEYNYLEKEGREMIDVKKMILRLYSVEGKSVRWLSSELGFARQTIRKAL